MTDEIPEVEGKKMYEPSPEAVAILKALFGEEEYERTKKETHCKKMLMLRARRLGLHLVEGGQ